MNTPQRVAAALTAVLAAGLIASCGSDTGPTAPSSTPPATVTSSPQSTAPAEEPVTATVEVSADTSALEHIHNLGLTGDTLLIGSHQGLFRQPPGQPPRRVGEPFDVMGFTINGNRWLASGHPGEGMNAPAAVLARAKGATVSSSDVHDAWSAWTQMEDPSHPSLVPYEDLDAATQAEDEAYAIAIRRISAGERT